MTLEVAVASGPATGFDEPEGEGPLAAALKREITDIILWADRESPRSRQLMVGPSELGDPCDRRLAYRLAGVPDVNTFMDPWPAIVGTAVHSWCEGAFNRYQSEVRNLGWRTEMRVQPDPMVQGRSDLYKSGMIVDLKTGGPDMMRKVHKDGPPEGYKVQVQLYGLGHENAGRVVESVALAFLPRSGWLGDMYVWTAPYSRAVATAALDRMYRIAYRLIELDIESNGHRFQDVDPTPGNSCVFCPMFSRNLGPDIGASERGCGGR
jgi:hypothetical protein